MCYVVSVVQLSAILLQDLFIFVCLRPGVVLCSSYSGKSVEQLWITYYWQTCVV